MTSGVSGVLDELVASFEDAYCATSDDRRIPFTSVSWIQPEYLRRERLTYLFMSWHADIPSLRGKKIRVYISFLFLFSPRSTRISNTNVNIVKIINMLMG